MLNEPVSVVFVDANVWFSRTLRDWIGMLYVTPAVAPFEVRWTEDVFAEVLYRLRRAHPDWDGGRITRIRDLLTEVFEVGRVDDFQVTGEYEGTDPFDAHIHAATVACGAGILLTENVSDFTSGEDDCPYEVLTPDEFFMLVDDAVPELVGEVAVTMSGFWFKRTGDANIPNRLRRAGCVGFADRVRLRLHEHADKLRW